MVTPVDPPPADPDRPPATGVARRIVVVIAAVMLVVGLAVGTLVGPRLLEDDQPDGILAVMCDALDQFDPAFVDGLRTGELDLDLEEPGIHLLSAVGPLADAATAAGEADVADAGRRVTAGLQGLQLEVAHDQILALRRRC